MKYTEDHKIILSQSSDELKWLDTRLYIPDPNSSSIYSVIWTDCGIPFIGRATFMPTDNYTNGLWEDVQHVRHTGTYPNAKVLFWMQNPIVPEFLK